VQRSAEAAGGRLRLAFGGLRERASGQQGGVGVQPGFTGGRQVERALGQLDGGQVAAGDAGAQLEAGRRPVLVEVEGAEASHRGPSSARVVQTFANSSAHPVGTEVLTLTNRVPNSGDW